MLKSAVKKESPHDILFWRIETKQQFTRVACNIYVGNESFSLIRVCFSALGMIIKPLFKLTVFFLSNVPTQKNKKEFFDSNYLRRFLHAKGSSQSAAQFGLCSFFLFYNQPCFCFQVKSAFPISKIWVAKAFFNLFSTSNGEAIEKVFTKFERPTEDCREKYYVLTDYLSWITGTFSKSFKNDVIISDSLCTDFFFKQRNLITRNYKPFFFRFN